MDWAKIPTASYVLFGIGVLLSIIHVVFCFLERELDRRVTKPYCVLFLFFAMATFDPISPLPYCGLFFGFVGDLLLLYRNKTGPLVWGTLAFLVNHLCNIAMYCIYAQPHFSAYIVGGVLLAAFLGFTFPLACKILKRKDLAFGAVSYFGILLADFSFAVLACALGKWQWLLLSAIGGGLFLISDTILCYSGVKKNMKRHHFWIMLTYLPAQILIMLGFVFTAIAV